MKLTHPYLFIYVYGGKMIIFWSKNGNKRLVQRIVTASFSNVNRVRKSGLEPGKKPGKYPPGIPGYLPGQEPMVA